MDQSQNYSISKIYVDKEVFGVKLSDISEKFDSLLTEEFNTASNDLPSFTEYEVDNQYYKGQSYNKIKKSLLSTNTKFIDKEFPPTDASIFLDYDGKRSSRIQWKRASDIVGSKFVEHGATRFDINQGSLGDCWFLAAIGNLTLRKKLFERVVPCSQTMEKSCGMFKFNFYQYGTWTEVVVDDYLPFLNNKLIFLKSDSGTEFWSSLLEKAYAKINGGYQSLSGGLISDAMIDFTGGITEMYDLNHLKTDLFKIMMKASLKKSLMGAGIFADPNTYEARMRNGLVKGHAYSITGLFNAHAKTPEKEGVVNLIRIRNPWGNHVEWNGSWSDDSKCWEFVDQHDRKRLLSQHPDGEFYMSKRLFYQNFDFLEICNLDADNLEDEFTHNKWYSHNFHGEWINGISAGGCPNNLESFLTNPQYKVIIEDCDEDDDFMATILVSLIQKDTRLRKTRGFSGNFNIGFVIFELKNPEETKLPLGLDFFMGKGTPVAHSGSYIDLRQITKRFYLKPGCYVIIPSTFYDGKESKFLLRTFTEKPVKVNC